MRFKTVFHRGKIAAEELGELDAITGYLRGRLGWLHGAGIDDLIIFFDELGKYWRTDPGIKKHFGSAVKFLSSFILRESLEVMLDTALRKREASRCTG
jgi:hypothetical protein